MILYVNGCVRENSRTDRLARAVLEELGAYEEIKLTELPLKPLDGERLEKRTSLLEAGKLDDEEFALARQFAAADKVVIAAPFWDGGFPAILKTYLENIYVIGIVSRYDENGAPAGLCKAKKLTYVTTAGGPYFPDFSYGYVRALATQFFGIKETELVFAENLDVIGNDAEKILKNKINGIKENNND